MRKEKSCGAVVFTRLNNEVKYLIEEMIQGHFALPKGHVEFGENEIQTASREIKEETNLDVTFLTSFKETTSYSPARNVVKDVVYFLAEANCPSNMKPQPEEVEELYWLNFEEAYARLTFDNDKAILNEAHEYLKGMK